MMHRQGPKNEKRRHVAWRRDGVVHKCLEFSDFLDAVAGGIFKRSKRSDLNPLSKL